MSDIAVLMSVYKNDSLDNLKLAVESVLNQTFRDFHFVIIADGKLQNSVYGYLSDIEDDRLIFISERLDNKGLAYSLNEGIEYILTKLESKYIFRMDSDDISVQDRFQLQYDFLERNSDIDVVGTDIIEFYSDGTPDFYKSMEKNPDMVHKDVIKKCPVNHPTVAMKASIFKTGQRYNASLMNTQDYYLWVDLLSQGYKICNINKALLRFRVDDNFHNRRGLKKAMNDVRSRCYAFKMLKNFNFSNALHVVLLFVLRVAPTSLKKIAYAKLR